MSLAIDSDKVEAVLVGNKWYPVDDKSFDLDAYEYLETRNREGKDALILLGGGQEKEAGVPATGFAFVSNGHLFFGPITAIQMVRTKI